MGINLTTVLLGFPLALAFAVQSESCRQGERRANASSNAPAASASSAATPSAPTAGANAEGSLREGSWGGQGISLTITAAGASAEFDCAHGRINQALAPDVDGHFDVSGTYEEEQGGATTGIGARDEEGNVHGGEGKGGTRAVRYAGRVEGESMTLTLTPAEGGPSLATFRLAFGAAPRLRKCR